MNILSSLTHLLVVSNLYDVLSFVENNNKKLDCSIKSSTRVPLPQCGLPALHSWSWKPKENTTLIANLPALPHHEDIQARNWRPGLLMRSTPSGCCWRGTRRRTSRYTWPFSTLRRHLITCPKRVRTVNPATSIPPGLSDASPACPNHSGLSSGCTRDPSSPCSCLSFLWPEQIFRSLSPIQISCFTL